ncbi:hypothetical protein SynA1825c_00798 [Synechococcus sp. A18-25c]|nr:hypothetical protein SynA1825c_00798 [Synechococcus sp. A18-25c]
MGLCGKPALRLVGWLTNVRPASSGLTRENRRLETVPAAEVLM